MPELQYWMSASEAAVFALTVLFILIGLVRLPRRLRAGFLIAGLMLAASAIWLTASQSEDADSQKRALLESVNQTLLPKTAPPPVLPVDAPAWMKVAYRELGQTEISGVEENARITEYFASIAGTNSYRDDGDDWASAFVEWSLEHASKTGAKNMHPTAWLAWGDALDQPEFGAVVVLNFAGHDHVGFYVGDNGDFVKILSGNQNDSVSISFYPKTSVLGYRKPS